MIINHTKSTLTKRGVASMYVVIFATLIFGIVTLSFVRIILSETSQTSNADLSRSAYDSALAGLEDAKIAIMKYHECRSEGYTADSEDAPNNCGQIISDMEEGIKNQSCDVVAQVLQREVNNEDTEKKEKHIGEVPIMDNQSNVENDATKNLEQAYTCVKITEDLVDYRSTLNKYSRTRVVPLRTLGDKNFTVIRFQWYSNTNLADDYEQAQNSDNQLNYTIEQTDFPSINNDNPAPIPPPMAVSLIQTDQDFKLNELSVSSAVGTDIARLTLLPNNNPDDNMKKSPGSEENEILNFEPDSSKYTLIKQNYVRTSADKSANHYTPVKCHDVDGETGNFVEDNITGGEEDEEENSKEFACSVDIEVPKTFNGNEPNDSNVNVGSSFLVVSLLYGTPVTDFSIRLCNNNGEEVNCRKNAEENGSDDGGLSLFSGVQTSIDSTGRANDLYRRVETRLELYDIGFPYPEFAIQTDGDGLLQKNFTVTKNCWWSNSGVIGSAGEPVTSSTQAQGDICNNNSGNDNTDS